MAGGINLFAYVLNNPVNFNDPEGKYATGAYPAILINTLLEYAFNTDKSKRHDYYRHCLIACRGSKVEIYDPVFSGVTEVVGAIVEGFQTASDIISPDEHDFPELSYSEFTKLSLKEKIQRAVEKNWDRDIPSNRAGVKCAENECETCEECCIKYRNKREQEEGP